MTVRHPETLEHTPSRFDVVANRYRREPRTMKWLWRVARRRTEAAREHLSRDDEVLRWVEGTSDADQKIVSVMVRAIPGRSQNDVALVAVEGAGSGVGNP